jgi:hypothetical protein
MDCLNVPGTPCSSPPGPVPLATPVRHGTTPSETRRSVNVVNVRTFSPGRSAPARLTTARTIRAMTWLRHAGLVATRIESSVPGSRMLAEGDLATFPSPHEASSCLSKSPRGVVWVEWRTPRCAMVPLVSDIHSVCFRGQPVEVPGDRQGVPSVSSSPTDSHHIEDNSPVSDNCRISVNRTA